MISLTFDFSFLKSAMIHIVRKTIAVFMIFFFVACGTKKKALVQNEEILDVSHDSVQKVEEQHENKLTIDWKKFGIELNEKDNRALYAELEGWIGVPYVYAGHNKLGTDCSGLVMEVFLAVYNKKLNRNSRKMQEIDCNEISKDELKESDLVFFSSRADKVINHVGIYLKDDKFIHAGSKGVTVNSLNEKYYETHYICSGRVKF